MSIACFVNLLPTRQTLHGAVVHILLDRLKSETSDADQGMNE